VGWVRDPMNSRRAGTSKGEREGVKMGK